MPFAGELLKRDQLLVGDSGTYRVVKPLGLPGATARVYQLIREKDELKFALKLMQSGLPLEMQKRFQDEMVNLQRLRSAEDRFGAKHIPAIIESSDLQQPATQELRRLLKNPFMIMDFAEGEDIDSLIKERNFLLENEALEISSQFAEVLYVLHSVNLTYTDMKLSNLFWNVEERQLTVIDWNVIAENRLNEDAPKDRLRAASYLYQMVMGSAIELSSTAEGVINQSYRRIESFKKLSEGTKSFLIKAFHPNLDSRHGANNSQLDCTREFMNDLKNHLQRFMLPNTKLIEEGKSAVDDRQWQDALLYLDIAERKSDIEANPALYAELQDDLKKVRTEAKKIERSAFYSGNGRYINGLYEEALDDFEKAMDDDPYDEEARYFAILAKFAFKVGEEKYLILREALKECVNALLNDHLDLADNALNRLPEQVSNEEEINSLKAEIKIRDFVPKGRLSLREFNFKEAQKFFRSAYQERDNLLYVETLEDNIGDLNEFYKQSEDMEILNKEGEAYFEEENFREAAWNLWQAKRIAEGSKKAYEKFLKAYTLDKIRTYIESGNVEMALAECDRTSKFEDDSKFIKYKKQVIDARIEHLRMLADNAFKQKNYSDAKEYIQEIIDRRPDDKAAHAKKEEIDKAYASGYREIIEKQETKLRAAASIEACEKAIQFIEEQMFQKFDEGKQFIQRTGKLREQLIFVGISFDNLGKEGNLAAQGKILDKAIVKNWTLKQGDPQKLKKELEAKLLNNNLNQIQTYLIHNKCDEALKLGDALIKRELPKEKIITINNYIKSANKLAEVVKEFRQVKERESRISPNSEDLLFEKLKLEKDLLLLVKRMKKIVPNLEAPQEIHEYDERLQELIQRVKDEIQSSSSQAHICLLNNNFQNGKKISLRLNEILAILNEFDEIENTGLKKWKIWNQEFSDLIWLLENKSVEMAANNYSIIKKLCNLAKNQNVKRKISALKKLDFDEYELYEIELDKLAQFKEQSPLVFWLYNYLMNKVQRNRIWKTMDKEPSWAEQLINQYIEKNERPYFEDALRLRKEVDNFFDSQKKIESENEINLEQLEDLVKHATDLEPRINNFPELKGKEVNNQLIKQISKLKKLISTKKKKLTGEYSDSLEQIFKKILKTEKEPLLRIPLKDEAQQIIERLRNLNKKKGGQFEQRLQRILKELGDISEKDINAKDQKRLNEFQRRVFEQCFDENYKDVDQCLEMFKEDSYFCELIKDYKKRHKNLEYRLKDLKRKDNKKYFKELLKLREIFGVFPELHKAIEDTKQKIFREDNQENFKKISESFPKARAPKDWRDLNSRLEKVVPSFLSEQDREEYSRIKTETENQLFMRDHINKEDLGSYLADGENEHTEKWIRAFIWNIRERNGEFNLPDHLFDSIKNCQLNWLEQKVLLFKSLELVRLIEYLRQELLYLKNMLKGTEGEFNRESIKYKTGIKNREREPVPKNTKKDLF